MRWVTAAYDECARKLSIANIYGVDILVRGHHKLKGRPGVVENARFLTL